MKITKEVLRNAKQGMEIIGRTEKNVFVSRQEDNPYRIDWMVEKGNYYFCGQTEDAYVYWDGADYGFTFSPDIFTEQGVGANGDKALREK